MADTPFPYPKETRETDILVGTGVADYGPFDFRIFDTADVEVLTKPAGQALFAEAAVTVSKVSDDPFDHFTVRFAENITSETQFIVRAVRVHERQVAVTKGGAISTEQLEKELSKQGTVLEELRRDVDQSMRMDYGSDSVRVARLPEGHFWKSDDDGNMVDGGTVEDIEHAQAYAQQAEDARDIAVSSSETAVAARDEAVAAASSVQSKQSTWAFAEANYSPVVAPDFIETAGYASAGDLGGTQYARNGAASGHLTITLDDGVTTVGYDVADKHPNPLMFGAVGDGGTNDTAKFAVLEAAYPGAAINGMGKIYAVSAEPTGAQYFNLTFKVGSKTIRKSKIEKDHPFAGGSVMVSPAFDGQANQSGPIWYSAEENRLHRIRGLLTQHGPHDGVLIIYEQSEDGGGQWINARSLYGHPDKAVSGTTGGLMGGGRFGLILAVVESGLRTWYFMYSDNQGSTWTQPVSMGITNRFPYGPMYRYPASAGGHDTDGWITYAYWGPQIWAIYTTDNGATWSETLVFDGTSSGTAIGGSASSMTINDADINRNWLPNDDLLVNMNLTITAGTGSGQTRRIANYAGGVASVTIDWDTPPDATSEWSIQGPDEIAVTQVNDEAKWVLYARGAGNFLAATSTDMTSLVGNAWNDSGIGNKGPVAGARTVGDSPFLWTAWGKIFFICPRRENWGGDGGDENGMAVWDQEADSLFANGGVYEVTGGYNWMELPSRPTGLPYVAETPRGPIITFRVGESIHSSSFFEAATNQLVLISGYPMINALSARQIRPGENLMHNAGFEHADRGESFPGITENGRLTIERWKFWASGGDFDVSRVENDIKVTRVLPHRPRYAMQITTNTPSDFSGPQQDFRGEQALVNFCDKRLTVQLWGIGEPPSVLQLKAQVFYGSGGSPSEANNIGFPKPVVIAGGFWYVSASITTPTLYEKSIGSSASLFRIEVNNGASADPWECKILGMKTEVGDVATPLLPPDPIRELSNCRAYFERLGGITEKRICAAVRENSTLAIGTLHYSPKVETPHFGIAGAFTIENLNTAVPATGVTFTKIDKTSADVNISHNTDTGYEVGHLVGDGPSSVITVDVGA
ncbi:hypothetical protein [uncultured Nitratireductor sp.]|uniref:hypothetical protein n=1 Tax=uncultured Nitratireductor sp. TaxID=520953 RepID=UPI0025EF1396|nr:hypothetical protein [uncultured Nitratireductor sp.]